MSAESQETGLWLWQAEAPPPQSRPEPLSGGRVILGRIVAAARWTGWIAPAGGLLLTLLATSLVLRSTALDRRISVDTRTVFPQSASPLIATHSLIPPPSIELPGLRLDQENSNSFGVLPGVWTAGYNDRAARRSGAAKQSDPDVRVDRSVCLVLDQQA